MRIVLRHLDKLRRTAIVELAGFCDALVSQFQDLEAALTKWAEVDHNSDGTHHEVRIGISTSTPGATPSRITLFWDGTDLKTVKPDGTVGTVTIV